MSVFVRWLTLFVAGLMVVGASARAPAPQPFTLLVIPERINLINISFDLLDKRPVALASYRTDTQGNLVVHAWTGSQWKLIPMNEYKDGTFLTRRPDRIILVGSDILLPVALVEASDWGPLVLSVEDTDSDGFLNAVGSLFDFSSSEWRWFANRYNMGLENITPASARVSWYDQMTEARQLPPRRHAREEALVIEPVEPLLIEPRPLLDDGADMVPEPIPLPAIETPEKGSRTESLDEQRLIK